jgi:beta-aspartyl-peptidase (threonine type)
VVEAVVRLLEDAPVFNAGTGSCTTAEGVCELDAIIADGDSLAFGAVAAVRNVRNPVSLARRVMTETPHCMLVGEGACRFATAQGAATATDAELRSPYAAGSGDTVGAVARDGAGRIAVATSTGGVPGKMPGRVGDAPLIGSGAWADSRAGGASATGIGEDLMRVLMARRAVDHLARDRPPAMACRAAVDDLERLVQGRGGVILLDPAGRTGFAFNTPRMAVAALDAQGARTVHV